MKMDIDFFRTMFKTIRGKLFDALETAKRSAAELSKRLPRVTDVLSRMREKTFSKDTFVKFVVHSKDKRADLLFWFRENAFLKDSRIFFQDTYARVVVRRQYTKRDLIALFILAVIIGLGLKAVATETITIGFEDYTLAPKETFYDLNALQKKLIDEGGTRRGSGAAGNVCSQ